MQHLTTRRNALRATGAILAGSAIVGTGSAASSPRNFSAHLTGAAHDLGREDTLARGQANFQARGDTVDFRLLVANVEDVTMGHIHHDSVTGPVSVWLHDFDSGAPALVAGRVDGVLATGTITDDEVGGPIDSVAELVDEIDAGNAFVNVHTQEFGGGEIGGQIRPRN